MKTIKKLGLLIAVIAMSNQAFAYKLIKIRDHWGVWGGFSAIEETVQSHIDGSGTQVIDIVTLNCKGWGDQSCCYSAIPSDEDGGVLNEAYIGIVNDLFAKAETQVDQGKGSGSLSEEHALQKSDGSFRYMRYAVSWNEKEPGQVTMEINELDKPGTDH